MTLLVGIPGVSDRTAHVILAEIGTDMSRFPTPEHLSSWAGMCPGNNESAGKHRSGRTRHGSKWLRIALVEAAHAAGRSKDTYLAAHYARIRGRRGPGRAAVAVCHSILVIAWHLLSTGETYTDLGGDYFDKRRTSTAYQSACSPNSKPWTTASPSNPQPDQSDPVGATPRPSVVPPSPGSSSPGDSHLSKPMTRPTGMFHRAPSGVACDR